MLLGNYRLNDVIISRLYVTCNIVLSGLSYLEFIRWGISQTFYLTSPFDIYLIISSLSVVIFNILQINSKIEEFIVTSINNVLLRLNIVCDVVYCHFYQKSIFYSVLFPKHDKFEAWEAGHDNKFCYHLTIYINIICQSIVSYKYSLS